MILRYLDKSELRRNSNAIVTPHDVISIIRILENERREEEVRHALTIAALLKNDAIERVVVSSTWFESESSERDILVRVVRCFAACHE